MTTILVVEDEAAIVDVLRIVFEEAGYGVLVATNGREALRVLATQRPAVIVTDYMMPGLDGLGLAQAVRDDPTLRGIPVVMMSAVRLPANQDGLWVAELPKPWAIEQVVSTVAALVSGSGEP